MSKDLISILWFIQFAKIGIKASKPKVMTLFIIKYILMDVMM